MIISIKRSNVYAAKHIKCDISNISPLVAIELRAFKLTRHRTPLTLFDVKIYINIKRIKYEICMVGKLKKKTFLPPISHAKNYIN